MLNIVLCDDQEEVLNTLQNMLQKIKIEDEIEMSISLSTVNYKDVILYSKVNKDKKFTNVYILDINLQDEMNGLDLAKQIRSNDITCFIVFLTAHVHLSMTSLRYKIEPFDYLIKPLKPFELRQTINEVHSSYIGKTKIEIREKESKISIQSGSFTYWYNINEIIAFEKVKGENKLLIHDKMSIKEIYGSLKDVFEKYILQNQFIFCHKSILINKDHIIEFDAKSKIVKMSNGIEYPVSQRKMKEIKLYVNCY